jgi:Tol biopolymer transport system component
LLSNVRQLTHPELGFTEAGEGYFSPDSSRVIFQAVPKGGLAKAYQIFTIAADGSGLKRVSTGMGRCTCAYYHTSGKKIVFASTHIGEPKALLAEPKEDGGGPAYRSGRSGYKWEFNRHMDVFEAGPDGGSLKRLTDADGYDAECAYSPDGGSILFTSTRDGDPEIYLMRSDGSDQRRLTRSPGYDGGGFISPDGRRIIFRADRKGDDFLQLFLMDIDGRNERQLTSDPEVVNWGPYWHPGGRHVIYATSLHGHRNYELYLLEIDTKKRQRVTYRPGFDGLPVFSPDGKKLMWTSKRGPGGTSQLFIADFKLPKD